MLCAVCVSVCPITAHWQLNVSVLINLQGHMPLQCCPCMHRTAAQPFPFHEGNGSPPQTWAHMIAECSNLQCLEPYIVAQLGVAILSSNLCPGCETLQIFSFLLQIHRRGEDSASNCATRRPLHNLQLVLAIDFMRSSLIRHPLLAYDSAARSLTSVEVYMGGDHHGA